MEVLKAIIKNEPTQMSSRSPKTSTTDIPREQHAALFAVINKVRMLNGWTTRTAQELDATIRTWAEAFDRKRIPYQQYDELYKRAFEARVNQMHRDGKAELIDAAALAVCWPGLAQEIEQERIASGRYLSETAISDCPRCFGSGMETVPGKGARPCKHEPVEPQERSLDPDAIDAVVEVIRNVRKEEPERPTPTSDTGWLNELIIRGGDKAILFNALDYVRAMRRKESETQVIGA